MSHKYTKGNLTKWIALAKNYATLQDWTDNPESIEWVCGCPEEINPMFSRQTDTRNPICKAGAINVITGIDGSVSASGAFDIDSEFDQYLLENECTLERVLIMTVDTVLSGNGTSEPMKKEPIVHLFDGVPATLEFPTVGGETREYSLSVENADYRCNISQDYIPECILSALKLSPFVTMDDTVTVATGATVDEDYLTTNANLRYSGFGTGVVPTFSSTPTPIETSVAGSQEVTVTYTDSTSGKTASTIFTLVIE